MTEVTVPPTGSHSTLARPHSPRSAMAGQAERRRGAQLGCCMASRRYMHSGVAVAGHSPVHHSVTARHGSNKGSLARPTRADPHPARAGGDESRADRA